jgi:hypothetical protein
MKSLTLTEDRDWGKGPPARAGQIRSVGVCLVPFSRIWACIRLAGLWLARLRAYRKALFAWLHWQSLHARSSSLVDWLYEQMQANHAMHHVWLPEYYHIPVTTFIGWWGYHLQFHEHNSYIAHNISSNLQYYMSFQTKITIRIWITTKLYQLSQCRIDVVNGRMLLKPFEQPEIM